MERPKLDSPRFVPEQGVQITIQVPPAEVDPLIAAVLEVTALEYGDYDRVSFCTAPGVQRFRSLGTGRNRATPEAVSVACVELSFFLSASSGGLAGVLEQIYAAHPYEEPVIMVTPCFSPRHIRGLDEDNPNRFWNRPPADWVPQAHRRDR